MIDYLALVVLVALSVKFLRTLAEKWGILEWLQAHSPNDFFYKLFTCEFCQSFWLGFIICFFLFLITGYGAVFFVPFFSSSIR